MNDIPSQQAGVERPAWRCFHCGEVFTSEQCARLHFGRNEDSETACVIKAGAEGSLLKALRQAEEAADDAIQAMHAESTDAAKAYHAQRCRHNQALIAAEELGYERGLADGRALAPKPEGETVTDDGWVMVPVKLTDAMHEAVVRLDFTSTHDPLWPEYWAAMLAASPKPTTVEASGMVEQRVKDILRGPDGEGYTYRGMEDAFFRWPVISRAILEALSASSPTPDQSNLSGGEG